MAGFVFGSSFSWIPRRLDNPLSCDWYLFHGTCNTNVSLHFTPSLAAARVTNYARAILFSDVESFVSVFGVRGL
jgi:hypothetical protein